MIRRYTLKDAIKHTRYGYKNLAELLSRYPSHGMRFKVYHKTWSPGVYFEVRKVIMKSPNNAKIYGVKYWNGGRAEQVERIGSIYKRGYWNYEIQPYVHRAENGMLYDVHGRAQLLKERDEFEAARQAQKAERSRGEQDGQKEGEGEGEEQAEDKS